MITNCRKQYITHQLNAIVNVAKVDAVVLMACQPRVCMCMHNT